MVSAGMTEDLQAQYLIEPEVSLGAVDELKYLQQDVKAIADNLFSGVKQKAGFKLRSLV